MRLEFVELPSGVMPGMRMWGAFSEGRSYSICSDQQDPHRGFTASYKDPGGRTVHVIPFDVQAPTFLSAVAKCQKVEDSR